MILTPREVSAILQQVKLLRYRVCLGTIYSCGLRLLEGISLQVAKVDSARMRLHVRGKGGKERYVPLPRRTLLLLRQLWASGLSVASGAMRRHPRAASRKRLFARSRSWRNIVKKLSMRSVQHCFPCSTSSRPSSMRAGSSTRTATRFRAGFTASPVAAGDHLYVTSEEGEVHVIRTGPQLGKLEGRSWTFALLSSAGVNRRPATNPWRRRSTPPAPENR